MDRTGEIIRQIIKEFFSFHRPPWQQRLPRWLRLAAEWQFGTLIIGSILSFWRGGGPEGLLLGPFVSGGLFLLLAGFNENRRITNPIAWWAFVLFISVMGLIGSVSLIIDPPDF